MQVNDEAGLLVESYELSRFNPYLHIEVYVCIYIYIYMCIHIYTHTRIHIHTNTGESQRCGRAASGIIRAISIKPQWPAGVTLC